LIVTPFISKFLKRAHTLSVGLESLNQARDVLPVLRIPNDPHALNVYGGMADWATDSERIILHTHFSSGRINASTSLAGMSHLLEPTGLCRFAPGNLPCLIHSAIVATE